MEHQLMLKRKGAEEPELLLDDFSGFPVSSRATKIRRLDAEVPPITVGAPAPPAGVGTEEVRMMEEVPPPAAAMGGAPDVNEERAIVVYKPADAARSLLLGPLRPGVPLRVSPDWIHGLKNRMLHEVSDRPTSDHEPSMDKDTRLAMVPWAPPRAAHTAVATMDAEEMVSAEDMEDASMEIEQGGGQVASTPVAQGEGLPQWPQHCMVPQQLQPVSHASPVTWLW